MLERCGVCHSLCLSVSLSFAKWFRHWKTCLQGLAVISRSSLLVYFFEDVQPFVVCVATITSAPPSALPLTTVALPHEGSLCVCIKLWGGSWVLLVQNRTSGLIIHAANTLVWPGQSTVDYSSKAWCLGESVRRRVYCCSTACFSCLLCCGVCFIKGVASWYMSLVICCDYKLVDECWKNNGKEKLERPALICYLNFGLTVTSFCICVFFAWTPLTTTAVQYTVTTC